MPSPSWKQYAAIKNLISEFCVLKDEEKYNDLIKKLTEILDV